MKKLLTVTIIILLFSVSIIQIISGNFNNMDSFTTNLTPPDYRRWKELNDGIISWSIVVVVVDHQNPSTV